MTAIRKRRKARGLTQQQVAEAIDISIGRYGRLERGENIKDETAVRARLDQFFDDATPSSGGKP